MLEIPAPIFPDVPATDPTITPPVAGETYNKWYLTGCSISSREGAAFDIESFWVKGNTTGYSDTRTNNIVRNFTDMPSLVSQLGEDWLTANPDVVAIMPQFLAVLAKIATRQGVL